MRLNREVLSVGRSVHLSFVGTSRPSNIRISTIIVVIHDLGTDLLLGQPAKIDNKIITLPHESIIRFISIAGYDYTVSYPLHDVLKISSSTTLFNSESVFL